MDCAFLITQSILHYHTTPPELGTSDFTIDWWEYILSSRNSFTSEVIVIDGTTGSATRCLDICYYSSTTPRLYLGNGGSDWRIDNVSIGTKLRDQWVHRAVVRSGNTIAAFENYGLPYYINYSFNYSLNVAGCSLFIGNFARANRQFVGKLKNVKIHVGSALWTEDFTPPTDEDYIALKLVLAGSASLVLNCDVERKVKKTVELAVDVERQISNSNFLVIDFDVERILTRRENFFVDVERKLSNVINFFADVERILTRTVSLNVDVKRTAEKAQYVVELLAALKVWLPFDKSTTLDRCDNTWKASGNPTISADNAISDNALQLDGSSHLLSNNIELGGQDFSIDAYVYMDSTSSSGAEVFYIGNSSGFLVLVNRNSDKLRFWLNQNATITNSSGYNLTSSISSVGKLVHVELNYIYSARTMTLYIDGVQAARRTSCPQYTRAEFSVWLGDSGFVGTIDEFRIFDGLALHSAPFTPPPAGYYEYLKLAPVGVTLSFDVERRITKSLELNFDVQRVLLAPIIVPAIGEHFNHIIGSLKLFSSGAQKIILPKTSGAYIRAVGAGIVEVYSDTDANRKILGDNFLYPNELYAALEPCENIFIKIRNQTTPQHVIKAFMKYLADFDGTLDEAINYATGGKFATRDALAVQFMNDLDSSSSYTDFLENYCDIDLDNADTGAITGSDAGGIEKTAESVVPEKIPVEDWIVPDSGEVVTINGLNVHFPNRVSGSTPAAFTAHILAGLYSVWIKQSLDLIEESYGLSFNDEDVSVRDISVVFIDDENSHATASTSYSYDADYTVTSLQLIINMKYFKDIDLSSPDGLLISSSQYYDAAGYLDRTLAHELTHAVMAVNIKNFALLPLVINEGLAELVHGIDDLRGYTSSGGGDLAAFVSSNKVEDLLLYDYSPSGNNAYYYVAGYLLLRYLAKQGQNQKSAVMTDELELTNLLISDGATDSNYNALTDNTRQILYPDVLRTLAKTCEFSFDVEILSVIRVDFTADVKRALLMHMNLFPINREDFFSDENNPYVVRKSRLRKLRAGQYRSPFSTENNSDGLQSFEVVLSEQQVTDQLRFTKVLPATAGYFKDFSMNIAQWGVDIMQEIIGQYLDYEYNMRVERIQRQGRTYSCECCSDLDKLLYTQLAYKVPATTTWTSGEGTSEEKTIQTVYPKASEHAKNIAKTLGLNFNASQNALFSDFLSTVLTDDMGGVTYSDLIRDIFGWSARTPHKMINVYIRNNTLWIIERGNEPNMIDISEAEKSEPIITRELVRTAWGSSITSKTNTTETTTKTYVPPDIVINTPDTPEEPEKKS